MVEVSSETLRLRCFLPPDLLLLLLLLLRLLRTTFPPRASLRAVLGGKFSSWASINWKKYQANEKHKLWKLWDCEQSVRWMLNLPETTRSWWRFFRWLVGVRRGVSTPRCGPTPSLTSGLIFAARRAIMVFATSVRHVGTGVAAAPVLSYFDNSWCSRHWVYFDPNLWKKFVVIFRFASTAPACFATKATEKPRAWEMVYTSLNDIISIWKPFRGKTRTSRTKCTTLNCSK